jgi:hypothetical protein
METPMISPPRHQGHQGRQKDWFLKPCVRNEGDIGISVEGMWNGMTISKRENFSSFITIEFQPRPARAAPGRQ